MTAAAVTAHAGLDVLRASARRNPREVIHAILDRDAVIGRRGPLAGFTRLAGQPVCGEVSRFGEPPDALWETVITCPHCAVTVRAEGIELTGCSL
jgi:hypothetical protein